MTKQPGAVRRNYKLLIVLAVVCPAALYGQTSTVAQQLPDAPPAPLVARAQQTTALMPQGFNDVPAAQSGDAVSGQRPRLTQPDAEKLAIKNNPRVSVARLLALAQHQVVRETRATELPTGSA
ncbi:MAG: hypothetical protein ABSD44_11510, partial [Terracidiphilus sp.]